MTQVRESSEMLMLWRPQEYTEQLADGWECSQARPLSSLGSSGVVNLVLVFGRSGSVCFYLTQPEFGCCDKAHGDFQGNSACQAPRLLQKTVCNKWRAHILLLLMLRQCITEIMGPVFHSRKLILCWFWTRRAVFRLIKVKCHKTDLENCQGSIYLVL